MYARAVDMSIAAPGEAHGRYTYLDPIQDGSAVFGGDGPDGTFLDLV